jgi:hypothetical protein
MLPPVGVCLSLGYCIPCYCLFATGMDHLLSDMLEDKLSLGYHYHYQLLLWSWKGKCHPWSYITVSWFKPGSGCSKLQNLSYPQWVSLNLTITLAQFFSYSIQTTLAGVSPGPTPRPTPNMSLVLTKLSGPSFVFFIFMQQGLNNY